MVICNFLQVIPDTIWQPRSMIILSLFNFQVLLLVQLPGPRTIRQNCWGVSVRHENLGLSTCLEFQLIRAQRDGQVKKTGRQKYRYNHGWSDRGFDGSGKSERVIDNDTDCSRPGSCPVQQTRCESALFIQGFLPCTDFLQDLSLKLSYYQSWWGKPHFNKNTEGKESRKETKWKSAREQAEADKRARKETKQMKACTTLNIRTLHNHTVSKLNNKPSVSATVYLRVLKLYVTNCWPLNELHVIF